MAVIRQIQAGNGLDTGSPVNMRIDDGVGQGLRGLGNSIEGAANVQADLAMRAERQNQQIDEFKTDQSFRRFNDGVALDVAKSAETMDPSGKGYTEGVSGLLVKKSEEFLKSVPNSLKPKFSELVKTNREEWLNKATASELDQRNKWYRQGISETQQGLQNQVFDNPDYFDAAYQDGARAIDASGLSVIEKEDQKRKWKETLASTSAERMVRDAETDPDAADRAASALGVGAARRGPVVQIVEDAARRHGVDPAIAKGIVQIESGFKPNAKAKTSSAGGLYQFIDGTAAQYGLKNKYDASESADAGARLLADNTNGLRRAYGREPSPGEVYLAHFSGFGVASKLGRVPANTPASDVFSPNAIRANASILRGKTIGEVRAWADSKMAKAMGTALPAAANSDAEPADPRFADMPLAQRLEYFDKVENASQRAQTAQNATLKAQYELNKDALALGIETGEVGSEITILNDPNLNDGDKATLLKAYRSKSGENASVSAFTARLSEGDPSATINPFDSDARKLGDNAYDTIMKSVAPEQSGAVTNAFIKQTGYIPEKVVSAARSGINGTNVQDVAKGLAAASQLNADAPKALKAVPNGDELAKAAIVYNDYVNGRGMSQEEAARRFMDMSSPEMVAKREQLKKPAADFIKGLRLEQVTSAFDPSSLPFNEPSGGMNDGQKRAVLADYTMFAEEAFIETGGDAKLAKSIAVERMKDVYGVSNVSGSGMMMKYPPEAKYPTVNGTHDYIREVALEAAQGIDATATNVMLMPDPEVTASDFRSGQLPRYRLMYQDGSGAWHQLLGQRFQVPADEIKRRIGLASVDREQEAMAIRAEQELARSPDGGREAALDGFLDLPKAPTSKPKPIDTPSDIKAAAPLKAAGDTGGFLARQKEIFSQSGGQLGTFNIDGTR